MKSGGAKGFTSERQRLETFRDWPRVQTATPYEFVQAGFYYSGYSDKVICTFCNGELGNWGPSDNPMEQHRLHFPECIFVQQYLRSSENCIQPGSFTSHSNVRPFIQRSTVNISSTHHSEPGEPNVRPFIQSATANISSPHQPKTVEACSQQSTTSHNKSKASPDYTVEKTRLQSFKNWPLQYPDVVELARAGFYYMGAYDLVKCFACGGLVKCWRRDDDPWIEHAKFFPKCKYLHMCLGEDVAIEIHGTVRRQFSNDLEEDGER